MPDGAFGLFMTHKAGFYLYVYDSVCCTHGYLQDTFDSARDFAREEFGVPVQSWSHEA